MKHIFATIILLLGFAALSRTPNRVKAQGTPAGTCAYVSAAASNGRLTLQCLDLSQLAGMLMPYLPQAQVTAQAIATAEGATACIAPTNAQQVQFYEAPAGFANLSTPCVPIIVVPGSGFTARLYPPSNWTLPPGMGAIVTAPPGGHVDYFHAVSDGPPYVHIFLDTGIQQAGQ